MPYQTHDMCESRSDNVHRVLMIVVPVLFGHSDVLSVATALDDFIAPDCRFINIRKGQMVYVYSKLVPEEGSGVFWSGSVRA